MDKMLSDSHIKQKLNLGQKFCKIFRTHSASQVSIIRTGGKELALPSTSSNHIHIFINISLRAVNNSNPRVLKRVSPSFKNLNYTERNVIKYKLSNAKKHMLTNITY